MASTSWRRRWSPQDIEACVQQVLSIKGRIIVTGVGKSGLIASKIAATLSSTGTPASFMHLAQMLDTATFGDDHRSRFVNGSIQQWAQPRIAACSHILLKTKYPDDCGDSERRQRVGQGC